MKSQEKPRHERQQILLHVQNCLTETVSWMGFSQG